MHLCSQQHRRQHNEILFNSDWSSWLHFVSDVRLNTNSLKIYVQGYFLL